jgi:predicted dehydrogenase
MADARQSVGGAFDLLIHDVDICLRPFGKPEWASANGHEKLASGIDVMEAELSHPGGWSAYSAGGRRHPKAYPFMMEYTVVMDQGAVDYSSQGRPPAPYGADGYEKLLPIPDTDAYAVEIEYFIEAASLNAGRTRVCRRNRRLQWRRCGCCWSRETGRENECHARSEG